MDTGLLCYLEGSILLVQIYADYARPAPLALFSLFFAKWRGGGEDRPAEGAMPLESVTIVDHGATTFSAGSSSYGLADRLMEPARDTL